MSLLRTINFMIPKIISTRNVLFKKGLPFNYTCCISFIQERRFRKAYGSFLRVMKSRRKIAGPERLRRRSEWDNWNYKAELYAFSQRLKENISEETLRRAFMHDSYIKMEEQKRRELDIPLEDVQLDLKSNADLISLGQNIMSSYLKRYLRHCFVMVPEEGICALHDYLLSDDVLSHVSFNIGTSDLIFCAEYPVEKPTLAAVLKAIIGAIATDDNIAQAEYFVLDLICPQLIGKDVFDIWNLNDPLTVLSNILEKHGHMPFESRLIFESGRNTIEAIYHVGLYSNKIFLGRGPGETLAIAEEMAAYDSLRRLFHIKGNEKPLPFGQSARKLPLNSKSENQYITEWYCENFQTNAHA